MENNYEGLDLEPVDDLKLEPVESESEGDIAPYVRAALGGATMGGSAGIEGLGSGFYEWLKSKGNESLLGQLDKSIRAAQEKTKTAEQEHPLLALGGAIAAPNPLGKLGAATKGAGLAKRALYGVASGALQAGAEAAALDRPIAPAAVGGGAFGGLGGAASPYIQRLATAAAKPIKAFAEERAFKALDPYWTKELEAITRQKALESGESWQGPREIGRTLLDRGIVKPFSTSETTFRNLSKASDIDAKAIEGALDASEAAGAPSVLKDKVLNMLLDEASRLQGDPSKSDKINALLQEAQNIEATMAASVPMRGAEGIKRGYYKELQGAYGPQSSSLNEFAKKTAARGFKEGVEESVGASGYGPQFSTAKERYAELQTPLDLALMGSARQLRNRIMQPSDIAAAASTMMAAGQKPGGSLLGEGMAGAAAGIAHKLARRRGSSTAAAGAEKLGNRLQNLRGSAAASQNPLEALLFRKEEAKRHFLESPDEPTE